MVTANDEFFFGSILLKLSSSPANWFGEENYYIFSLDESFLFFIVTAAVLMLCMIILALSCRCGLCTMDLKGSSNGATMTVLLYNLTKKTVLAAVK